MLEKSELSNLDNGIRKLEPVKQIKKSKYSPYLNAKGSNSIFALPVTPKAVKARFSYNPESEEGSLFTNEDLKFSITNFNSLSLLGRSIQFFLYCLKIYTKTVPSKSKNNGRDFKKFQAIISKSQGDFITSIDARTLCIDFNEYLETFNIPNTKDNRKNAKRNIKKYYDTLKHISFDFEEYSYKHKKLMNYSLELFSGKAEETYIAKNNNLYFILNSDFVSYITEKNFITFISDNVYSLDFLKHPNSLAIIFKLSVMYSMNISNSNKGLISVKNLLSDVLNLPSYEEVKKLKKSPYNAIIEPLERDLDYLEEAGLLKNWEYCNEKREPLTENQLENYSYQTLIKSIIKYELPDYPEEKLIERHEQRQKEQAGKEKVYNKKATAQKW